MHEVPSQLYHMYMLEDGHPVLTSVEQVPTPVPFSLVGDGAALAPRLGSRRVLHLRGGNASKPSLALHLHDESRPPVGLLSSVLAGKTRELAQVTASVSRAKRGVVE